ncbi:MAG: ComEC/Rec2 family competence protein [Akkermansia sp.]|nr:ComEC/Rec2 family competence protein [Akkermansia sp.]
MIAEREDPVRKIFRHLFLRAPLLLPLLAVLGCLWGGELWGLSIAAVCSALLLNLKRIACCTVLCAALAFTHQNLQQRNVARLLEQLTNHDSVELVGTVERRLSNGCILDTGLNGVRVALRGEMPWHTGDFVKVVAIEQAGQEAPVEGMFSTKAWLRSQGLAANMRLLRSEYLGRPFSYSALLGFAESVRGHLLAQLMPEDGVADRRYQVLCSLVLGDKSQAEADTLAIFKRGGCLHAFAVSGLHVGIVSSLLYLIARLGRLSPRMRTVLVLVVSGLYVLVTGLAVPALRAYLMIALVLLGLELRRPVSYLNIWSLAALIVLLLSPWQLHNAGFVLSFAVYAAIGVGIKICMTERPWLAPDDYIPLRLYTPWHDRLRRLDVMIRGLVYVSLSAWLISQPITAAYFHSVTPFSFLTNIAISPVLPIVMCLGLLAALTGAVPLLGGSLKWIALQSSSALIAVVEFFGALPGAYLPTTEPLPPSEVMVGYLGYGSAFTVLGNPGLVIDSGSELSARFRTEPALFYSGCQPAALLLTSRSKESCEGAQVLKGTWPSMSVLDAALCKKQLELSTSAGEYDIYLPPADIPRKLAADDAPVVKWRSGERSVLYVGNAASFTYELIPPEERRADILILGCNARHPLELMELAQECSCRTLVLLPSANVASVDAELPENVEILQVSEETPLLRFNINPL